MFLVSQIGILNRRSRNAGAPAASIQTNSKLLEAERLDSPASAGPTTEAEPCTFPWATPGWCSAILSKKAIVPRVSRRKRPLQQVDLLTHDHLS